MLAVWALILSTAACAREATTALLRIDGPPGTSVVELFGQVSVASRAPSAEQQLPGPLQLPGTLVVLLPDVAASTVIALRALTADGETLHATVFLQSIPYREVDELVTLAADGAVVGGAADGGTGSDLANASVQDLLQAADGAASPMPDLSTGAVARDTFQRPDQPLWGRASDGQLWAAEANTRNTFAITQKQGLITDVANNADSAVLGPPLGNADVLLSGSIDTFAGANEIGPMARWTDGNNFYKAVISGSILKIVLKLSGSSTDLVSVPFTATAGTPYQIRFRAAGPNLSAKAWPAGSAEPASWMVSTTDSSFASGYCGLRIVFNSNATAHFTLFTATTF